MLVPWRVFVFEFVFSETCGSSMEEYGERIAEFNAKRGILAQVG